MGTETDSGGLDDDQQEPIIPISAGMEIIMKTLTERFGKKAMQQFRNSDLIEKVVDAVGDASDEGNGNLDNANIMDLANEVVSQLPNSVANSLDPSDDLAEQAEAQDAGKTGESADKILKAAAKMIRCKPIRNEQPQIGRNDLCPCGSGKKFKKCCMNKKKD